MEQHAPPSARAVFDRAVEIHPPEQRQAYLAEACGNDVTLRQQVDALLKAYEMAGSFLEAPAHDPGRGATTHQMGLCEGPGATISHYKLLEQIGEGGMGVVFLAEQQRPVRRQVALKVVKAGMDTRQVVARFESERQALALMDHPNIAKVLDAGATETGRPYFVMELVKGVPITRYCDERRLTPRDRLALFVHVCSAVQHAHTKGIIHRDLKPSNVLIALYDGKPVPKIIDFGVAKATGGRLTEHTVFTGFGSVVGTPEYMSPEQAELNQLDVDTRSDVYSLGVILYELLTGSTPVERGRFKAAALLEMLRVVREEEAQRPSTRLSTTNQLASIAASRGLEPRKLSGIVKGELDWIVMRCLEKDRSRRYETASGLAKDVERYLNDDAVHACPPSAGYRVRKFARRNKRALAMVAVAVVAVLIATTTLGWSLRDRRAREREASVETAGRLALTEQGIRQALDRGTRSRADLHAALKKPTGVQQLLNQPARWELFIKTAQSELAQARQLAAREGRLNVESTQAMNRLEQQLTSDQADYDLALRLEKIRADSATWVDGRFDVRKAANEYPKAFAGLLMMNGDPVAVAARLASSPIKDQLVAALDHWGWVVYGLGQNDELAEQLLAVARYAAPDPDWGDRLRQLKVWGDPKALDALVADAPADGLSPQVLQLVGLLLRDNKPLHESWLRRAQAEYPADFWLSFGLAAAIQDANPVEGAGFYRVALAVRPGNSAAYNNLGTALQAQGKVPEAITAYRKAVAIDPLHVIAHCNLGNALKGVAKVEDAIACYRTAIEIDPKGAYSHACLGHALGAQGKFDEAITHCRKAIELDPELAFAHTNLGDALVGQKKFDEAITCFRTAITIDPKSARPRTGVGNALMGQGNAAAAIVAYRESIELDPKTAYVHNNLGRALKSQGNVVEAITSYHKAIEVDPRYAPAHNNLGLVLKELGKLDDAIDSYRKSIEINPRDPKVHNNLGHVLMIQGKLDDAIAGYRKALQLDPQLPEARHNLGIALAKKGWEFANSPDRKLRDSQRAIEAIQEAVEVAPQSAFAWQYLGWAQYRAGSWKASLEALEKSCKLQNGGGCGQWIVMSLDHWKLATGTELPEQEREQHKAEARRRYDLAAKRIVTLNAEANSTAQEIRAFRAEASELLGVKEEEKEQRK